jgi:hypothetical protein
MSNTTVAFTPGQLGTAFQVEYVPGIVWARAVGVDRLTSTGCGAAAKSLGGYYNGLSSPSFAPGGLNSPVTLVSPQGVLAFCNTGDESTVAGLLQTLLTTTANRSNGSTATTLVGPMQTAGNGIPSWFVG